jgi:ectoine hydroxylase-related dioxygenase (phytanoyl-CoA dioxygenase family)
MREFQFTRANLQSRNIASDNATIGTRIEAYRTREPAANPTLIIPEQEEIMPLSAGSVPEIPAEDFDADSLRSAIAKHGALIVRNVFSQQSLDGMIDTANQVIDACESPTTDHDTYYDPPSNLRTIMPNKDRELGNTRNFHRESGSAMCVEAPSVAEELLKFYEAHGLKEVLAEYLGEPPCLTAKKWVLRRSKLPVAEAGWHQDGAFMGTNINSINMWLPLTHCGGETGAPGMDVVPQRLNRIASAEGAQFNWSVSDSFVGDRFAANRPLAPEFNPGDAFFFDHFYLHRTQYRTDFTRLRYAIETWFFGASSFPKNQIPLAW